VSPQPDQESVWQLCGPVCTQVCGDLGQTRPRQGNQASTTLNSRQKDQKQVGTGHSRVVGRALDNLVDTAAEATVATEQEKGSRKSQSR